MWFFDDAFTTSDAATPVAPIVQQDSSLQATEVVVVPPAPAALSSLESSLEPQIAPSPATDIVLEAPIFSTGSDVNTIVQEETPMILSQEVVPDVSFVEATPIMEAVFTPTIETPPEAVAVFEPIVAASVVEQEVIPTPVIETPISVAEINIAPVAEIQVESPLNVRNPEDILDDTERLLRQSERALEDQAKILEWEAAAHQATSNIEKEAADSALQAAQSAHAKADKLEATITSIQKEKEKLSVSA